MSRTRERRPLDRAGASLIRRSSNDEDHDTAGPRRRSEYRVTWTSEGHREQARTFGTVEEANRHVETLIAGDTHLERIRVHSRLVGAWRELR